MVVKWIVEGSYTGAKFKWFKTIGHVTFVTKWCNESELWVSVLSVELVTVKQVWHCL